MLDEVSQLLDMALERQRRLVRSVPGRQDYQGRLANTLTSLGNLQMKTEPQRALKTYDEALEIRRRLVQQFPNVPEYRYRLGDTLYDRAARRES